MLNLALAVLFGGASVACGFAALGLALYALGPDTTLAAALFGGVGFVAGVLCAGLQAVFDGLPARGLAVARADALAGIVRASLASASAERQVRPGSAADRRPASATPTPAPLAIPAAARPRRAVTAPVALAATTANRFASSAFGA